MIRVNFISLIRGGRHRFFFFIDTIDYSTLGEGEDLNKFKGNLEGTEPLNRLNFLSRAIF